MRQQTLFPVAALSAFLLLASCEAADRPTAPDPVETETQQSEVVTRQDDQPDGDYSLFFGDLDQPNELEITVSQTFDPSDPPLCSEDDFQTASGEGLFLVIDAGRFGGTLTVTEACFRDWNDDAGWPEEASVKGKATVGGAEHSFEADLISNKFPSFDNFFPDATLDEAVLTISDLGIDERFQGELHHEDRAFAF